MRRLVLALVVAALAAAPARAADPVLVAVGDIACAPDHPKYNGGLGTMVPAPGECHQLYTSDLALQIDPLYVLALGDLQYNNGAAANFAASYAPTWGRVKSITKPVPGNHEYGASGTDYDPNAAGYFGYFQSELAAEGAAAGDPQKGWYSYDVPVGGAKWHLVALNSECAAGLRVQVGWDGDCDVGSDQERWLRADLAADRSDCTLAYWHHPRFSSGVQDDNTITAPIWNALYEDHADVVLSGHDHIYERFAQADPSGARAPGRGIRSWIVGTGGKNMGVLDAPPDPATEVRHNATFGVLKLTLHGPGPGHPKGWYQWEFVDDGNSGPAPFADSGSGDCVDPPDPAPVVRDALAPLVFAARMSRRRFRLGSRSVIAFTLSERATATLRFDRRRRIRGRIRHRRVATLKRKFAKGRVRLKFTGRVGRRKLSPGLYRLTITVKDAAGNAGRARRLFFRVLR